MSTDKKSAGALRAAEAAGRDAARRSLIDLEAMISVIEAEMRTAAPGVRIDAVMMLWVAFLSVVAGHAALSIGPQNAVRLLTTVLDSAKAHAASAH